jgi:CelD/BcsL family acetyltransferase involved in cellulose biosynthesis
MAQFAGAARPCYQGLIAYGNPEHIGEQVALHCASGDDFDVFVHENLASLDRATSALNDALRNSGWCLEAVPRHPCHRILLPPSFDTYLRGQRSSKSRYNLRRSERLLRAEHDVRIERIESNEIDGAIMERVATIQRASWMRRRSADHFSDGFYRRLVVRLAEAGFVRLWMMRIDEADAAFVLGTVHGETLLYEWTAFRLEFARHSIGQILTAHVLDDACAMEIRTIDFLHGNAEYKRYWANDQQSVSRAVLGHGARGRLVAHAVASTWRLRRNEYVRGGHRLFEQARRSVHERLSRTAA